jgi:ABC-type uncharacterized transport system YnjBCD permease subunit
MLYPFTSMLSVTGREWIAPDGIRVAELAAAALDPYFATAMIANNLLGCLLRRSLRSIDSTCTLRVPGLHRPITSVLNDVTIIL